MAEQQFCEPLVGQDVEARILFMLTLSMHDRAEWGCRNLLSEQILLIIDTYILHVLLNPRNPGPLTSMSVFSFGFIGRFFVFV